MKKKIVSMLLALALVLPLVPAARAAGTFADVTDAETARNAEVLRLMGVIEGDGDGTFRPNGSLTRAEFCKMTLVLQNRAGKAAGYRSRTVFPDVPATHWAVGYVNLAAAVSGSGEGAEPGLMHGFPDGTFRPDKPISYGEAVTVLMRALGYEDKDTGGIWPDGYLALAASAGMSKGISLAGGAEITRAQAVKLFVNALTAKKDETDLLTKLGYVADLTKTVTLYSVDTVNGELRTSNGAIKLAKPMASTALNGLKGYVVMRGSEAATFLPAADAQRGVVIDAAIIVSADGSTAGIDALTGGAASYTVYRNGVRSSVSALKKYDVLTYNPETRTLHACDTRVLAYYEACNPSPSAPATITALGGTTLTVLPTARTSLAAFKPGDRFVLQFTADGQIAGATAPETRGAEADAFAFVGSDGTTNLICGGGLVALRCSGAGHEGEAVRIAQDDKGKVFLSAQSSGDTGSLELSRRMLGSRRLASDVLVFNEGMQTSLEGLGSSRIDPTRIAYARVNGVGEVDMLVIADTSGRIYFGRANVEAVRATDDSGKQEVIAHKITIDGNGHDSPTLETGYVVKDGAFVEGRVNGKKTQFNELTELTKLTGVTAAAWIGDTAVNHGGRTYEVYPETVLCWNGDSERWLTATSAAENALDAARAYGGTMDLYVKDGVVRVVEVHA